MAHARHAASGVRLRPQVCVTTNTEEFHERREYRGALEKAHSSRHASARSVCSRASATAAALASADVARGEPSPGADVARGEPSPGADVARVGPVPVQMWQG